MLLVGLSIITSSSAKAQPNDLACLVDQLPQTIQQVGPDTYLIDFGKVAFGNIEVQHSNTDQPQITVHFGEAFSNGRINRTPPGTVRYAKTSTTVRSGIATVIAPNPDRRNTEANSPSHPPAILTPKSWGTILPFRWVEIEGWKGNFTLQNIKRRAAFAKSWDDRASAFHCSDPMLNRIWDLCKYSIKATNFAGVFVDGDRERIPYEADAYLNQLSYYATSSDNEIPRRTFDHLMKYGTWPTEWAYHMIFMAHADWMQTGDTKWLAARYDALKAKLLSERAGPDGLILSAAEHQTRTDIVDWPAAERDGFIFSSTNTVVNAFYIRSLGLMSEMAKALGRNKEAADYETLEKQASKSFRNKLFNLSSAIFRDGDSTEHSSSHANLFPLAFGLVPTNHRQSIAAWLYSRGMRCSVYAAQYLLQGLFDNDFDAEALKLITAEGDRSWRHMVESGTTITWEAWDQKYKPNQDWNHAWGAAPANLLPRYILGAQPLVPGWKSALIRPNVGSLTDASGTIPTPLGPVKIKWKRSKAFQLNIQLPAHMNATIELPFIPGCDSVLVNGKPVAHKRVGNRVLLEDPLSGTFRVDLK